jgi:hypothetical protein
MSISSRRRLHTGALDVTATSLRAISASVKLLVAIIERFCDILSSTI